MTLTRTRLANGIWEGRLAAEPGPAPAIEARHQGQRLDGVEVTALPDAPGSFAVRLPIPASVLSDGVQTILLCEGDEVLARIPLIAGQPLDDDLGAEIALLRAELDLLKRAFRRQMAERS